MRQYRFLITCEQCGTRIPPAYAYLIAQSGKRVPDIKVQNLSKLATLMAKRVKGQTITDELSNLLIDRSKPLHRDEAFSEYSKPLSSLIKKHIIKKYYHPFREEVEDFVKSSKQPVFHIILKRLPDSVHAGTCIHLSTNRPVYWLEEWRASLAELIEKKVELSSSHPNSSSYVHELVQRFPPDKYHYVELLVDSAWLFDFTPTKVAEILTDSLIQTINTNPTYQNEAY